MRDDDKVAMLSTGDKVFFGGMAVMAIAMLFGLAMGVRNCKQSEDALEACRKACNPCVAAVFVDGCHCKTATGWERK
jgi:hypothetical protein